MGINMSGKMRIGMKYWTENGMGMGMITWEWEGMGTWNNNSHSRTSLAVRTFKLRLLH